MMFGYGTCFNCGRSLMGYGYPCVQCDWGDKVEFYGTDNVTFIRIDIREGDKKWLERDEKNDSI